jgi:aryl-alcohol dehydrogenase-like predicted oxidoreductase
MNRTEITRRRFLKTTIATAGAAAIASCSTPGGRPEAPRTAVDRVSLGTTGLTLSRLGIGTGSQSGEIQRALGQDGFDRLIRHAHERGITFIDTADSYKTHTWIRQAVAGIPREKLFIQTKMGGVPENPIAEVERYLKELGTDYLDSLLVHCVFKKGWTDERKRVLDALDEAKAKKLIRAKGVTCHNLGALEEAARLDWVDVNLVRVNPQGAYIDTPVEHWEAKSDASHVPPVLEQLKTMRARGHGVIGMKICGNGDFTDPRDRETSIRFAMQCGLLDAVVIGLKSPAEVDEAIERIDRALAGAA